MTLSPEDLQALGVDQFDPYAVSGLPQQSLDAMTRIELPQAPAAPAAPTPDKLSDPTVREHALTAMRASLQAEPAAPKGLVKAGETVRVQDDGLTPEERAAGTAVRGQAAIDTMGVDRDRLAATADAYEQQAAKSRAEADVEDERRKQEELHTEARMQRIREDQDFLAEQKDEPIDPQRYFKNMSLFGKAMALISAAAYGYVNSRNGEQGQAPIIGVLQQMASEDTRAQMADVQNGRAKRSDQMALYERKYGDQSLIAKKLEADKLQTLGKRAMADAKQAKSAEAKASMEDMGKKMLINADVLNQTVSEALSAQPMERTTTFTRQAGKGIVDPVERAKKTAEAAKALEAAGVGKDAIAKLFRDQGIGAPTEQTAAEREATEKDAKAAALTPEQKKDLRDRMDGLAESVAAAQELDDAVGFKRNAQGEVEGAGKALDKSIPGAVQQVAGHAANMLPWGASKGASAIVGQMRDEEAKKLERIRDTIVFGQAKADGQGALSEGDREVYRMKIPIDSPLSLMAASTEQWRARRQKYKNLVGQYGKGVVDAEMRSRGGNPLDMGGE